MKTEDIPHEQLKQLLNALESETVPMAGHQDPNAIKDCWRLAHDLIEEMINHCSHLAASICPHAYGDEWGNQRCSEIDYLKGVIKQTEQDAAREIDKYRQ